MSIFLTFTVRDVPPLQATLDKQMSNIKMIRDTANSAGVKLSPEAIAEIVAALQPHLQSPEQDADEVEEEALEPTKNEIEAKTVKDVFKKAGINKTGPMTQDAKKQQELASTLKQAGLPDDQTHAIMNSYNAELEKAATNPPPAASDPQKAKSTSHLEILLVDGTNGSRSIIAQAYLELLRTWTANANGTWLFKRADSAGLHVRTPFRASTAGKLSHADASRIDPGRPCFKAALDALAGDDQYFASKDSPREKSAIFDRVRMHKGQGLAARDFARYHYILCFDWSTLRALRQLSRKARAQNSPTASQAAKANTVETKAPVRIMMLSGVGKAKMPLPQLVRKIRPAIKEWVETELDWMRPARKFAAGPNRTRFLALKDKEQKDKLVGSSYENIKGLAKKSGCLIRVSWQGKEYGHMVAIVGPKETLPRAERLVRECVEK